MASTIRISKSKALNFKKLSFLYLIFIVFFFFSTAGDFIKQFSGLANTQKALNDKLKTQFFEYSPQLPDEILIKDKGMLALSLIDSFQEDYNRYTQKHAIKGEKLKEQQFSKRHLLSQDAAARLHGVLRDYILAFPENKQGNLAADLGFKPEDLGRELSAKNRFLIETPNGAIPSVLHHFETVILMQSLKYFKQEIKDGGMMRVSASKDSTFLQGFKNVYYIGEKISFDFFSRDSIAPEVQINELSLSPDYRARHYHMSWTPVKEGVYFLEAHIGEEFIRHRLNVIKPSLRFLENEQEIAAFLSEPMLLTLDMNGLENIKNLKFTSNGAKIERKGNQLEITPLYEGRFTIEMKSGETVLDAKSVFALNGRPPEVILKDVSGQKSELSKAHCLESLSPYWQVINFNVSIVYPNGSVKELKSHTRFLRNEVRSMESAAPAGSTIVFSQIRLLNSNGKSTAFGAPIFIGK